jgi:hypothetical protein
MNTQQAGYPNGNWRKIDFGDGKYYVNEVGQVYNTETKNYVSATPRRIDGRLRVTLRHNGRIVSLFVHRLIAAAFIPNPENKREVNHIDGNPTNNALSNLEWVTPKENIQHAWRTGLHASEKHGLAKMTHAKVSEMRELRKQGKSYKELSEIFGLSRPQTSAICRNKFWITDKPQTNE